MADLKDPFSQAINEFVQKEQIKTDKQKSSKTTTAWGLAADVAKEYPRGTAGAVVAGLATKGAITNWKKDIEEASQFVKKRIKEEKAVVKELAKKGVQAIPRLDPQADTARLARQYATEKIFSRFPFNNASAQTRIVDFQTPRVILTGENIPVYGQTRITGPETDVPSELKYEVTPKQSGVKIATTPREVTLENAKKIPRLDLTPRVSTGEAQEVENALRFKTKATRVPAVPKYSAGIAQNPNLYTRMAEVGTGGVLGKANVGAETALALYDIAREGGETREAYKSVGGGLSGLTLGGLKGLSRLGRAAGNALTLGTGEFLGVYDTVDLLQVESDALKLYERKYGKEKIPDPLKLSEIEANLAAQRGIPSSPMASDFYQGPEYRYKILNGKLVPMMTEEAAAMFEFETERRNQMLAARPQIMNIDPSLGTLGYTPVRQFRPEVIGEYSMYDGR